MDKSMVARQRRTDGRTEDLYLRKKRGPLLPWLMHFDTNGDYQGHIDAAAAAAAGFGNMGGIGADDESGEERDNTREGVPREAAVPPGDGVCGGGQHQYS